MQPPIIDFSKCGLGIAEQNVEEKDLQIAGKQLYEAFSTSGFAYISKAGILRSDVQKINNSTDVFFNKSSEYKESFIGDDKFGYDKKGVVRINPKRPPDYHEGFRIASSSFTSKEVKWPDVPYFEESVKDFSEMCRQLSLRVLRALGKGMKLKDSLLLEKSHKHLHEAGNQTVIRVIYYPSISSNDNILPHQVRFGEHSDWGTITLLFQDEIGGLQIKNSEGNFIDVKPIPDTIVINVGDMLSLWSDGSLKSTVHRVVFPDDPELRRNVRRSIAYFVNADDDTVLSKLEYETMVENSTYEKTKDAPATITALEYITDRTNQYFVPQNIRK